MKKHIFITFLSVALFQGFLFAKADIFDEISGNSVLEQPKEIPIESFDEIVPSTPEELQLHLKERAFQGDPSAQWELARMYCDGNGVPQDYKQAAKWFTRAAEQGYAKAQDELGYMYVLGHGVPQDDKQADKWWTKATEHGSTYAQTLRDSFPAPPNGMFSDLVEQQAAPVRQTSLIWQIVIGIAICLVLFLIYKYLLKKILRMIRGVLQKRPHLMPAIIAAVMLFGALGQWPDDYYQLLRFVTCCVSVYVAYTAYTWQKIWAVWLFGFIAVLFNPLAPIHFSRELWQYIDIICAVLFAVIAFILRKPAEEK